MEVRSDPMRHITCLILAALLAVGGAFISHRRAINPSPIAYRGLLTDYPLECRVIWRQAHACELERERNE